jgi:elongation factor P--beta-lysine ligase
MNQESSAIVSNVSEYDRMLDEARAYFSEIDVLECDTNLKHL